MSMLDRWNAEVQVFAEVTSADADGNVITRPSVTGVPARAMVQPYEAVRDDQSATGFDVPAGFYRLRFIRYYERQLGTLGPQSQIEHNGSRWAIVGEPVVYNGSRNTAHTDYVIRKVGNP